MAEVRITNNTDKIMAQFRLNMKAALQAIGVKAVNLTLQKMKSGYGRPIRKTGDLMRDVTYEVENGLADSVDVGNTLHYATFVHDGTRKMAGRPYLRDAIIGGQAELEKVAAEQISKGLD